MAIEKLDYQGMVQDALRGVVRRCLELVAEHGLPGEHYFYVGFRTRHPGVRVPGFLRDQYPEETTIVLQHQFWDLEVDDEGFSVALTFNASQQRVYVPFAAMTAFVDPSAEFGLRFGPGEAGSGEAGSRERPAAAPAPAEPAAEPAPVPMPAPRAAGPAVEKLGEVVPFDPSRRK